MTLSRASASAKALCTAPTSPAQRVWVSECIPLAAQPPQAEWIEQGEPAKTSPQNSRLHLIEGERQEAPERVGCCVRSGLDRLCTTTHRRHAAGHGLIALQAGLLAHHACVPKAQRNARNLKSIQAQDLQASVDCVLIRGVTNVLPSGGVRSFSPGWSKVPA
eukprot:138655-Chlamydomonas_euryale.AAC.1